MMMSLRDILRGRVCQFGLSPDYSLGHFVNWANEQRLAPMELLHGLDELQTILDLEAEALQKHGTGKRRAQVALQRDWCLYCEKIRAHLRQCHGHGETAQRLAEGR